MRGFEERGPDLSALDGIDPGDPEYSAWQRGLDVSCAVWEHMRALGWGAVDFAEEAGLSAPEMDQIIEGSPGMTLRTLTKAETVLGRRIHEEIWSTRSR